MKINIEQIKSEETLERHGNRLFTKEQLKEMDDTKMWVAIESDAPDREEVDFSIYSSELDDNVAWAWGTKDDYEVECNHEIEWGDDDEQGRCMVCGKTCEWHWEDDGEGGRERVPHAWHEGDGGMIKEYVEVKK